MKRFVWIVIAAALLVSVSAQSAAAQVEVRRRGSENPAVEVFRSTIYGGLAGLAVGLAISAIDDGGDDGEIIKNSFAIGTFAGLGLGIYFVATRPQPSAMLELRDGEFHLAAATPQLTRGGGLRVHVIGAKF